MSEPASDQNLDEDLIEATIRRVAEAQAAREAAIVAEPPAPATQELAPDPALAPLVLKRQPPAPVDEDAIEAAIRRVAEAKAAREQEPPTEDDAIDEVPAPRPRAAARKVEVEVESVVPEQTSGDSGLATAVQELGRRVAEHDELLRDVLARIDVLAAAPPRPARGDAVPAADGWDEDAPLAPMPVGMPPRPAILRDAAQDAPPSVLRDRPAEPAAPPAAEVIDRRPLPAPLPPIQPDSRRGLDLLPRTYRITVEDKRRGVDLVPLHRALLAMDGVRDMSLLSYNNGVALVSLETVSDIDPEALRRAVARAMSRDARVETHNEHTLVVKLAED